MKVITYIILIGILATCSGRHVSDKQITAKMIKMERQMDSLENISRSMLEKAINFNEAVKSHNLIKQFHEINNNAEYAEINNKLDSIKKEYDALLKTTVWYKGRNLPFEPVLTELHKSYKLNTFHFWKATDSINYLYIADIFLLPPKYIVPKGHGEDIKKIKSIINNTLKSEPIVNNNLEGERDSLVWMGSRYDIKLYNIFDGSVWIDFSVKKNH
jgi:hypothetical protein